MRFPLNLAEAGSYSRPSLDLAPFLLKYIESDYL